jgi:hypothetical protein
MSSPIFLAFILKLSSRSVSSLQVFLLKLCINFSPPHAHYISTTNFIDCKFPVMNRIGAPPVGATVWLLLCFESPLLFTSHDMRLKKLIKLLELVQLQYRLHPKGRNFS